MNAHLGHCDSPEIEGHADVRLGFHAGRNASGWWAEKGRRTACGRTGSGMTGGSFWDLIKFFVVPRRYYVWRYERRQRGVAS